ncbi:HigA family addiction module antitoxin [Nitrococcus mobilis]|nr:HigA family addiction module antitoxin [Nitrococcus mobilis]
MTGQMIGPIHPGEHLAEFLEEYRITQYRLAKAIHVPPRRINEIVQGRRGITADTALRLARFFGTSAEYWMRLQDKHELEAARARGGREIEREIRPLASGRHVTG